MRRLVGEASIENQYILYYCGNIAVTFKAKASIAVHRVRVSPGASPAFDFREIYPTISSSTRGNELYEKKEEKKTKPKAKDKKGMGKRRARRRKFAAVLSANGKSVLPDQKISGRYRVKVSNESKTWREHCHRSYPDIFDSFAFMTEEISMPVGNRSTREEVLKRGHVKKLRRNWSVCDNLFL